MGTSASGRAPTTKNLPTPRREREKREPTMLSNVQRVTCKAGVGAAVSARRTAAAKRTASSRASAKISGLRSLGAGRGSVKVQAGGDFKETAEDLLTTAAEKWEETEDKPTVVTLAFAALITLIVTSSLLGALDKVPFLGGILELVGIGYTAYFAYNNLLFTPDREKFAAKVDEVKDKVL